MPGISHLFKRSNGKPEATAQDRPRPTLDGTEWASLPVEEGLPLMTRILALDERTWGFKTNVDSKIQFLSSLLQRMDSEDDLVPKLARNQKSGRASLESYEDLSEFGQSLLMLLFGVGNLSMFLGAQQLSALRNTVEGEAAELRTVMLVNKAYEVYGKRALVAAGIEMFMPTFSQQIDKLPDAANIPDQLRQSFDDFARVARHTRDLFYYHYRPLRMPDMSMVDPVDKQPLPMADIEARALQRAALAR